MNCRSRCRANDYIELVASNEPARCRKKYGERRLIPGGRRKQHAQPIALIEVDKPSRALATVETDFGDTPRSIAEGQAILARFGAGDQNAALPVDPDRLAAAQRHLLHFDWMAAPDQVLDYRLGIAALDLEHAARMGEDAWRLGSLLRIHAAVEQTVQEGRVADRLIVPTHHPERHHRAAVFDQHRRDDRVKGPLPRCDCVRMVRGQHKSGAAVLQQHTALRREYAGAKAREQRIDKGAGIAVAVYDAEIHRILVLGVLP